MTTPHDVSDVAAISPSADAAPEPAAEPHVAEEGAQLSLKVRTLDQKTYPITICAAASVPQLKELVAHETGITLARQRLIYRGRVLKNDQTLASYSVEDGHVLHLVVRAASSSSLSPQTEEGRQGSVDAGYTNDVDPSITGVRAASYQRSASDLDTLTEIDALNTRLDEFHRSSLRSRSRSRQRQRPTPAPPRDNDEPDPTMATSSSTPPGRVLMGATIAVPEGTDVTMPFLSSMIANLVTQVSGNGMRGEADGTTPGGHRHMTFSTDLPSRSTATEIDAATARALRHHHRNRDGSGRQRSARRSSTGSERHAALRARTGLRLESVRATLNDPSLDFPAELTALSQGDTNTAMSELQQQVDMLLTLLERFGPRLRLLPAALAQRDRLSEQAASNHASSDRSAAPASTGSRATLPTASDGPEPSSTEAMASARSDSGASSESTTGSTSNHRTAAASGTPLPARQVIRTIEALQTIGETADLLARMARHAFLRQSGLLGEPTARRGDSSSTTAGDRIQARFQAYQSGSRASNPVREGVTVIDEIQATLDQVQASTRTAGTAAQGVRPRIRVARISAANLLGERSSGSPRAARAGEGQSGLTPNFPIDLTGTAGGGAILSVSAPASSEHGIEPTTAAEVALTDGNGSSLSSTGAHISISGVGLPLMSSVVFPFSLAAGLGGSHATTTWNLADFVSRLTNELPISTIYGVLAGDATHLHHILAHVGFALFSGVDVPRITRPNLRTWVQDFVAELRRLVRFHALPADVVNQVDGSVERRLALGNELLRVVEPFIPDLIDFLVRATSASRAAAFGTRSATFLRSMAQQVVRDLRRYGRGDALETERESDERLERLLRGLLAWLGMNEHIARFVVESLLCWTEGNNAVPRRGRLRQREEATSADSPATKRQRE